MKEGVMGTMRLDKYLSAYAGMTRKEARQAVHRGVVAVDGIVVKSESMKVEAGRSVTLNGETVQAEEFVYYMMNKPAGVITATKDTHDKTVLDLVPEIRRAVFPMGRLDKDTEGLLILTDDGALSHRLLSPKFHVEKVYEVEYEGELAETAVDAFARGLDIGERRLTKPASLLLVTPGRAELTLSEGKFHQVKRMFAVSGACVTGLRRIAFAGITLDEALAPGDCRRLTEAEVEHLRSQGKSGTDSGKKGC